MPRYFGHVSKTPNLAQDNYALEAASGESGKITEVRFSSGSTGGGGTSMDTEVSRTNGSGTVPVLGNVQKGHPNNDANKIDFVTGWTSQPVPDAGALLQEEWLSAGGVVRWLAGPDEEWIILGAEQISCRNNAGLAVSSYRAVWHED